MSEGTRSIGPQAAHDLLGSEDAAVYVDVRSTIEFEQGHPEGAWNLPLFHAGPAGMTPNPDFAEVASSVLPRDAVLVVGCKSGQRSAHACAVLAELGFAELYNVDAGFGGVVDPFTRQVTSPGWQACGLPVATEPQPGRSWPELADRARRQSG